MKCYRIKKLPNDKIINRVYGSDDRLFNDLYHCYKDNIIGYLKKSAIINDENALDLYHLVFITFYENIQKRKLTVLTSSLSTYLIGIAKYKLYDFLKKKNKNILLRDSIEQYQKEISQIRQPDNDTSVEERFVKMEEAFRLLKERCQKILSLYYFKRENMQKIAMELKLKSDKVAKNEKYKCVKKLKDLVKN